MTSIGDSASQVNKSRAGRGLGIRTSIASPTEKNSSLASPVIWRFYLQSLARELLPRERVAHTCLRRKQRHKENVLVYKHEDTGRAHYGNLCVCGSIWQCPVCAARISEGRRQELAAALLHPRILHPDGSETPLYAMLITYTFRHNRAMTCSAGVSGINSAFRRLKSGKGWQELKDEYGLVGSVRALENLWGLQNGWHPHIHELMLSTEKLSEAALRGFEKAVKLRWRGVLAKEGLNATLEHGVTIERDRDGAAGAAAAVLEYIAKFGHDPKERPEKNGWTITHELVKSVSKASSRPDLFTMPQLLAMYGDGDLAAGRLWQQYAIVMKGRNQLVWSRGLRDLLGLGAEKDDGDLAAEAESQSDRLLAALNSLQWRAILRADLRGEVLHNAGSMSEENFTLWLADVLSRWDI